MDTHRNNRLLLGYANAVRQFIGYNLLLLSFVQQEGFKGWRCVHSIRVWYALLARQIVKQKRMK